MEHNALFEKTSPLKLFFLAAIPGGISMLASSIYGVLDGIFVGRILGETAFAAVNLVFPLIFINFSLADLIGVGSAVPISIALGRKEEREANNIFTCACILIVLTGTLMGALFYIAAPALVALMGAEGELASLGVQYMRVYALTAPVTTIVFAMDNYLRICGKIKMSMNLNILMSVISILLEFTFLRIFRWGIGGAALASCSGMFICAFIAFWPFWRRRLQLKLCKPKFSTAMIHQIVACGSPNFLSNIAGRVVSIIMNIVLLNFGGESAISVFGVLMYVGETLQSFLYGVCDSLQPAVGYNWGAQRRDRVKAIESCCFTASAVISLGSMTLMFFLPRELTKLFMGNADEAFFRMAVPAMKLYSLGFSVRWFSFATQSYMTAVSQSNYAAILSVSTAFVFPLALIGLLWPFELTGIWLNFPMTYLLSGILAAVLLVRFYKIHRT